MFNYAIKVFRIALALLLASILLGCSPSYQKPIFSANDKLDFRGGNMKKKKYYLVADAKYNLYSVNYITGAKRFFGKYRVEKNGSISIFIGQIPLPLFLKKISAKKYVGKIDNMMYSLDVVENSGGMEKVKDYKFPNKKITATKRNNYEKIIALSYARSSGLTIGTIAIGKYSRDRKKAKQYIVSSCKKLKSFKEYAKYVEEKCIQYGLLKYNRY